jgi:hypothetical protein
MENIHARLIHGLIKKENRVKAVEASGYITMLKAEDKCNDSLVESVNQYVGILSVLYRKFEGLSVYQIQKKTNPIETKDFALFTQFHIEITELMKVAKG